MFIFLWRILHECVEGYACVYVSLEYVLSSTIGLTYKRESGRLERKESWARTTG